MNITLEVESDNALGIKDGDSLDIYSGCYMSKDANFYHVELGHHKLLEEPIIRVTGHDKDDEEVTRYVLVNPLDDEFRTLAGIIYHSEYLGEV